MPQLQHEFNPSILREYDIRGTVDKTISVKDAYAVGRTFGSIVARSSGKKVGLCFDGRHSSSFFANALIKGLNECGLHVENYGLGPTPMVYYALHERGLDAGIAITGSHNPYDHNGIKMALSSGPFYGAEIKKLAKMARFGDVVTAEGGSIELVDIYDAYLDRLAKDYNPQGKKPLKIVWDCGNGVVGSVLRRLTERLPGEHEILFEKVDGDFPNHHPDPVVEKNLADIKRAVIEKGFDLGIAFDGDGDRIGVVDRTGEVIWPDKLLVLYAKELLPRAPGSTVIVDIKCSKVTLDLIAEAGGKPIMWKAGHSLVKSKMKETNASLGGELSGHIFFKEGFYGHDDALYCAVRLLNVIHALGDLSELKAIFPKTVTTPEIRFHVPEENKFNYIQQVKEYAQTRMPPGNEVLDIDGIRVNSKDGWWLVRASNTESALTARAEALSPEGLARQVDTLQTALKYAGAPFPDPLY
jgi:phosphomannomutase